jgi:hypothetical protein
MLSVVLGLGGGDGTSPPIRSTLGAGFLIAGGEGCAGAEEIRCEDERSSLAFSWTMFRGC